jgi:hypothetical protein
MKMGHGRPQENEKHLKNALENSISMTPYSTLSALKGLHLSSKNLAFAEKSTPAGNSGHLVNKFGPHVMIPTFL